MQVRPEAAAECDDDDSDTDNPITAVRGQVPDVPLARAEEEHEHPRDDPLRARRLAHPRGGQAGRLLHLCREVQPAGTVLYYILYCTVLYCTTRS